MKAIKKIKVIDNDNYLKNENSFNNLKISFSGHIYNFKELNEFLRKEKYLDGEDFHNEEIILKLIDFFYKKALENAKDEYLLLENVKIVMNMLNGDFVFSISDGKNSIIVRDHYGLRPLFFKVLVNNQENNPIIIIGKNRKTLWNKGITNPNTLKPGYIIFNGEIIDNSYLNNDKKNYILENSYLSFNKGKNIINDTPETLENFKILLKDSLIKSIEERIEGFHKVGLLFSGGVDSTIIAKILKNLEKKKGIEIKLYTVGTPDSSDLEYSKKIAKELNLNIEFLEINEKIIEENLEDLLIAIEEGNIIKIGVGMTIHLGTKLAKKDDCELILTGQGADELFAGYHRYLETLQNKGEVGLEEELRYDIENMYHVNLERDIPIAMANGIDLRSPFLDKDFLNLAINIPIKYKIKSNDDKLRKYILREIAIDLDIPEYISYRQKKAAQYGSGINKILKKKILKEFDYEQFFIDLKNSYLY